MYQGVMDLVGFGVGGVAPASYVFNGTDEHLARTLSTSGANTTKLTLSFWSKASPLAAGYFFAMSHNASVALGRLFATADESFCWQSAASSVYTNQAISTAGDFVVNNTWNHYVLAYDSTQGTQANRIKIYKNGTQLTFTQTTDLEIASNEEHQFFNNGQTLLLSSTTLTYTAQKIAFIDVLEGVAADPTAFCVNVGGTWTRKRYTGSYGTYGFCLDGSNGFNDVSGNGQNFTGTNMDESNLDTADLPPHVE
jgi:hypothetical protein